MTDKMRNNLTKQVKDILKTNHLPVKWFDDIIIATENEKTLAIVVLKKDQKLQKANVERVKERCTQELGVELHITKRVALSKFWI